MADLPSGPLVWPPHFWVCHGFDGEGCDHTVAEKDLDWQLVSDDTEMKIDWTLPLP